MLLEEMASLGLTPPVLRDEGECISSMALFSAGVSMESGSTACEVDWCQSVSPTHEETLPSGAMSLLATGAMILAKTAALFLTQLSVCCCVCLFSLMASMFSWELSTHMTSSWSFASTFSLWFQTWVAESVPGVVLSVVSGFCSPAAFLFMSLLFPMAFVETCSAPFSVSSSSDR